MYQAHINGMIPKCLLSYKLNELVGRDKEKKEIQDAVRNQKRVILIKGNAGIGKTRILEELPKILDSIRSEDFFDIVDFYDTAMHNSLGLEEYLAHHITEHIKNEPTSADQFKDFFQKLHLYRLGVIAEKDVHEAFVRDFNQWNQQRWLILRFDTGETLEYGQDAQEIKNICEIEDEVVSSGDWLLRYLPQIERTTTVIACRKSHYLHAAIQEAFSNQSVMICLQTLSLEDIKKYFQQFVEAKDVDDEMIERIWLLTDGRPILVSLAIDWLICGVKVDDLYEADISELKKIKETDRDTWEIRKQMFEKVLVYGIRQLETPLDTAIYYAGRAKKGFNAKLIQQMLKDISPHKIDLNDEQTHLLMDQIKKLSFVKVPYISDIDRLFLHDEMYQLLDKYVWDSDYPEHTHHREVAEFIANQFYEKLINEVRKKLEQEKKYESIFQKRRYLNILLTEQLFYRLEADPSKGYDEYDILNIQANSEKNNEWDDMLRTEMLRFMKMYPIYCKQHGLISDYQKSIQYSPKMLQECSIRWLHRYVARGNYEKAYRVAHRLLDEKRIDDSILEARIRVILGEIGTRKGLYQQALQELDKAISVLHNNQTNNWINNHYLATAYLYKGLIQKDQGKLSDSYTAYEKACEYFEKNKEDAFAARTKNNMGYILCWQGKFTEAKQKINQAIQIRQQNGDLIGAALSYNTLAIAELWSGATLKALTDAREALRLIQSAQRANPYIKREIALVYINLGEIHRVRTRSGLLHPDKVVDQEWKVCEKYFREAEKHKDVLEPSYHFELYNRLGTLFTNWGKYTVIRTPNNKEQYKNLMKSAEDSFAEADKIAKNNHLILEEAYNLEDWAWVYYHKRRYHDQMKEDLDTVELEEKNLALLEKAEEIILPKADPKQNHLPAHYIAGSIYHQFGRHFHRFKKDFSEALKYYSLSVLFYQLYTSEVIERREIVIMFIDQILSKILLVEKRKMIDNILKEIDSKGLPTERLQLFFENILITSTPLE